MRLFEWEEDDGPPVRSRRRVEPTDAVYWLRAVLVLLTVVWLLTASWQVVAYLGDVAGGVGDSVLTFFRADADQEWAGRTDAQRHARRVALLSLLPAAGVLLALAGRRHVAAGVLGVGAVLGLLIGVGMVAAATPDAPDVPERRAPYCGEHSGEPARCPGG